MYPVTGLVNRPPGGGASPSAPDTTPAPKGFLFAPKGFLPESARAEALGALKHASSPMAARRRQATPVPGGANDHAAYNIPT
ncbi:MAG: hypothetical protein JXC32_16160 [Anaerolineae bacterium]|nr:hypothetical protein [Anaerolineae bacterium]